MKNNIEFIYNEKPHKYLSLFQNEEIKIFYSQFHELQFNTLYYQKKILNKIKKEYKIIDLIPYVWNNLFDEKIIFFKHNDFVKFVNNKEKNLNFYDLFLIDIIISYFCNTSHCLYIPITQSFIEKNDPIDIYKISDFMSQISNKKIYLVTDDLLWANIFTPEIINKNKTMLIPKKNFYWVESDFDLFTYSLFFPNKKFKKAGSSSNIFSILEKNPNHKAIIDRDGFSRKNISYLKELYNIYFTKTSECENIWLLENMLILTNDFLPKKINISTFKEQVIERANNNLDNIMIRFKNRQDYLMYQYIPYLNEEEIKKFKNKCINHIQQKRYNNILNWFDNKKLFDFYLKESYTFELNNWKKIILKNQKFFSQLENDLII